MWPTFLWLVLCGRVCDARACGTATAGSRLVGACRPLAPIPLRWYHVSRSELRPSITPRASVERVPFEGSGKQSLGSWGAGCGDPRLGLELVPMDWVRVRGLVCAYALLRVCALHHHHSTQCLKLLRPLQPFHRFASTVSVGRQTGVGWCGWGARYRGVGAAVCVVSAGGCSKGAGRVGAVSEQDLAKATRNKRNVR